MPEQDFQAQITNDPINEIIGKEPNWLIRWGTTVVLMTVVVLILGSYIIKYPEVVRTRVTITTEQPPVKVVSRSSGKIVTLFVENNRPVTAGDYLAILENTANFNDIRLLEKKLTQFQGFLIESDDFLDFEWNPHFSLGEIQPYYAQFLKQFDDWRILVKDDFTTRKIERIEVQLNHYKGLKDQQKNQSAILEQELALALKKLDRHKELFKQKLISETELATVEDAWLGKKYTLETSRSAGIRNAIEIGELNKTIFEMRQERRERNRQALLSAREAYKNLSNAFAEWERRYILKSPASGRISFFKFWSVNQYVNTGDEVLIVVPEDNRLVGKIFLPQVGSGKVQTGQAVHIKFDGYPYTEFGMVKGRVHTFSEVARDNVYQIDVALPSGLKTTYEKELAFKYNMQGSAEIITRDMRLIERIFNQFRHLMDKNS